MTIGKSALVAVFLALVVALSGGAIWTGSPVGAVGTLTIAHAGLPDPVDRGEDDPPQATDWDAAFARLHANGVTAFFPDTDSIAAFVTTPFSACDPQSDAFRALRENDLTLIVPGFLLYPPGWLTGNETIWTYWFGPDAPAMPPVPDATSADDPLRRLIACAGGVERIYAVTNYDEPAFAFDTYDAEHRVEAPVGLAEVEALYERVKAVGGDLPVMMVHAPIPRAVPAGSSCTEPPPAGVAVSPWDFVTPDEWVADYLARVEQFSVWADWVGFDLYPVPDGAISRIITDPYRGGLEIEGYASVVRDYLGWLDETIGKPRFLVSQGFSYAENAEVTAAWCLPADALRAPAGQELTTMNREAQDAGAFLVLYWGIRLLQEADVQPGGFYDTLLDVFAEWGE